MEEKVLVQSKLDKKWNGILLGSVILLFVIGIICLYEVACNTYVRRLDSEYYNWGYGSNYIYKGKGFSNFDDFKTYFNNNATVSEKLNLIFGDGVFWAYILTLLLPSFIVLFVYLSLKRCSLTVTTMNVRGRTMFGKEVVLPLNQISAYTTKKWFSTIAVATSSGMTKFALIGNYQEIDEVLAKLINERQMSQTAQVPQEQTGSSNLDELKKLKELLDAGIITQEEFDVKKKELLQL